MQHVPTIEGMENNTPRLADVTRLGPMFNQAVRTHEDNLQGDGYYAVRFRGQTVAAPTRAWMIDAFAQATIAEAEDLAAQIADRARYVESARAFRADPANDPQARLMAERAEESARLAAFRKTDSGRLERAVELLEQILEKLSGGNR